MITPSKRHIGFIILIILLISQGIKFKDFCFDDKIYFLLGALAFVFIINFLVVTFYNLYYVSSKKEFFDFFPLLSLALFGLIFYIAIAYPDFDFYKTKKNVFENQNTTLPKKVLKLYDDDTFVYQEKINDQLCIYKGKYTKTKKQLLLNFNGTKYTKITCSFDEKSNIIIKSDTLFVKNLKK